MKLLLALLVLICDVSLGADEQQYALLGGKVVLTPQKPSGTIKSLLWKKGPDKVAEWDPVFSETTDIYGEFEGRAVLDLKTGQLTVDNFRKKDEGQYSLELNGQLQSTQYSVKGINPVQKPTVSLKPLSCSESSERCDLSCSTAATDAQPLSYSWSTDGLSFLPGDALRPISSQDANTQQFYCQVHNPVSQQQSNAMPNPFYKSNTLLVIGIVIAVIVLLVVGAVGVLIYKNIMVVPCWSRSDEEQPRAADVPLLHDSSTTSPDTTKPNGPGTAPKEEQPREESEGVPVPGVTTPSDPKESNQPPAQNRPGTAPNDQQEDQQ